MVDIIRQHHGDGPVLYFYDKAQKLYGDQVDISAFRYEGPRPQTREAAIVMLADTIEAATRALPNPDPEKIDALIRKLVRGKHNDGQLDASNLTFNDLDKICSAFSTVLTGVFHERIEYPDINVPPRLDKPVTPSAEDKAAESARPDAAPQPSAVRPAAPAKPGASAVEPPKPAASQPAAPVEPARNGEESSAAGSPAPSRPAEPSAPTPKTAPAEPERGASAPSEKAAIFTGQTVPPVRGEDDQRGAASND